MSEIFNSRKKANKNIIYGLKPKTKHFLYKVENLVEIANVGMFFYVALIETFDPSA